MGSTYRSDRGSVHLVQPGTLLYHVLVQLGTARYVPYLIADWYTGMVRYSEPWFKPRFSLSSGKTHTARYIPVRQLTDMRTEIDHQRSVEEEKGKKKKKKKKKKKRRMRRSTSRRPSGDSARVVAREPSPPALP
ncbi:hypothetical protein BHE74_00053575 [Ensete ventricosum]|nr:hypothetical protein GW17_00006802 [Ensete ventricosum]RWW40976.1 hypothetical protein BHE74_00053575 [Ensete ventricosum]